MAAAMETGFCWKVEMIWTFRPAAISGVVTTPERGVPLAMLLPITMISGTTSQWAAPYQYLPVRPNIVCTSSSDEEAAVLVGDVADDLEVLGRRSDEAADARHRFADESGDLARR